MFPLCICSDIFQASWRHQRGIQEHVWPHTELEETADQVQSARVHGQTAHIPGSRLLFRLRSLHSEEKTALRTSGRDTIATRRALSSWNSDVSSQ